MTTIALAGLLLIVQLKSPANRIRICSHRQHNRSSTVIANRCIQREILRIASVIQTIAAQSNTVHCNVVVGTIIDFGSCLIDRNNAGTL